MGINTGGNAINGGPKVHIARKARKFAFSMATLGLAGGIAVAAPGIAQAAPDTGPACTGTCTGNVTGSVSISTTLTLSLSGTSFTLTNVAPGVNTSTISSNPLTATVSTNDANGYILSQALAAETSGHWIGSYGFYPAALCTGTGSCGYAPSAIDPYAYPGNNSTTPAFSSAFSNGSAIQTASSATSSAASGDAYTMGWQFTTPANMIPETATGGVTVLLVGN